MQVNSPVAGTVLQNKWSELALWVQTIKRRNLSDKSDLTVSRCDQNGRVRIGSPPSHRLIPGGKKTMSKACDLTLSYNPRVRSDIIGLRNFRPGLAISDPRQVGMVG